MAGPFRWKFVPTLSQVWYCLAGPCLAGYSPGTWGKPEWGWGESPHGCGGAGGAGGTGAQVRVRRGEAGTGWAWKERGRLSAGGRGGSVEYINTI